MRQYRRIKSELPDGVILFFRLGDFYEMFFDDAKRAAPVLDIALTKRNGVPMCGVPFHASESYLAKLVRAGLKVAVCDQVEDASSAKGIVRREVERIVTPGTVMGEDVLSSAENNFLMSVCAAGGSTGIALMDLSTGLFFAEELSGEDQLRDAVARHNPSECLVAEEQAGRSGLESGLKAGDGRQVTLCEDWIFEYDTARETLMKHFGLHSLDGLGCEGNAAVAGAAGGLLYYVKESLRRNTGHVRAFSLRAAGDRLVLDEATIRNLNLIPVQGDGGASLLKVLDSTKTAMGARKLRQWLLLPPAGLDQVEARLNAVERLYGDRGLLAGLREGLDDVRDMERLITRIGSGGGNARDLRAIARSLACVPGIKSLFDADSGGMLREMADALTPLPGLVELVERAIVEEPPLAVKEGGVISEGYNEELDSLRSIASSGRKWLAEYQAGEQERTGIKTLKVRHNRVFGYYIEVSKGQLANVPAEYERRQTLVNAERFITPELKEYEGKIVGASDRANALEYEMFCELRDRVAAETESIQRTADAVAGLDVLSSFADRALALGYVRPRMTRGDALRIADGRHPVIEQISDAERFVPNDTALNCTDSQLVIITGPNMAGKSTYIRQVALIAIMAHAGSFVPAKEAEISVMDRVFTRVGASDDLARGRSTFMVEMQETANILNNASERSLIVLDEIGRGTSTFDGISIAWAVAEYLHNKVKAKTLFATHYHELTDLSRTMKGIKNCNVLVRERGESVVFLRRIAEGAADKSYGIQVARLAGLPAAVLERSSEILANLEENEISDAGQPKLARKRRRGPGDDNQMSLFGGKV